MATYLKTFQALSYERLQGAFAELFGLTVSQGGLMNMLRRAQGCFQAGRDAAVATLRPAAILAGRQPTSEPVGRRHTPSDPARTAFGVTVCRRFHSDA